MNMTLSNRVARLEPRQKPDAKQFIQEIRDAVMTAQTLGVFEKINRAHMTRRCLHEGQSDDGMRHGQDVFPWDRAIDCRVPLADEIVTEHVRSRMASMRAGQVRIGPMNEIEDSGKAGTWDKVLRYYRGLQKRSLQQHLKLFQTCVEEIGYGVIHVDWQDMKVLKPVETTVEEVVGFEARRRLAEVQEQNPDMELPPDVQGMIAEQATVVVEQMIMDPAQQEAARELLLAMDPTMPESEARKLLPELRRKRMGTYYAPRGVGGCPKVRARIPWVDCGHATDLGTDGKCSWWFVAEWLSEVDFRIRCEQEGCADKWRDEVIAKAENKGITELMQSIITVPDWLLNGVGIGLSYDRQQNQKAPMFQVLTVYRMAVNEAGIPACYETMLNVHVPEIYGMHKVCNVTELPFVAEARESAALMMQSRGIPEILLTDQLALKKLKDATTSMAELAAFPPYERAMGDGNRIAPGMELPVKRNTGTSGTQSRFLQVPGVDAGALKAMEQTRMDANTLFARGSNVDPDTRRMFLEELGEAAVLSYEEVMRLLWLHIQAYVNEVTASRVAGQPVSLQATAEDLEGTADITVEFSAMALNQKTALELADYVTKLAGLDKSGRIDFGKAVELITRIFDPVLSDNIILPGEQAAAEIEKDEQAVIAAISAGQYVTGRVNSPALRWQVLQQWLANPSTVQRLRSDPPVYFAMLEHIKGLQQEKVQRGANVFTGQTGQKPEAPWQEGQDDMVSQVQGMVEGQALA